MTRTVLVSLNYAPEKVGIGPFSAGLAEGLAAAGHSVEVIAGHAYYPQWKRYEQFVGKGWCSSVENGVRVLRCPHYVPAKPTGAKRLIHLTSFGLAIFGPVLSRVLRPRAERPELVICVAPALFSVPGAWLLACLTGAKLWIHIQDFEVEAAFATGLFKGGAIGWFARGLERLLLRLADRISSISPQMCAKLREKGVAADQIVELRNWANAPGVDPDKGQSYREKWGLEGKRVVLYSGTIANKQGIEIIGVVAQMLQDDPEIVFVVCSEGPNRQALEEATRHLSNVHFYGLQPAENLSQLLALASVHIMPQISGAADLVLPSKLANMLASGRPVVATADEGTALYDEVQGCGLSVSPGDAEGVVAAIRRILSDPELDAAFRAEALNRARLRWSYKGVLDTLEREVAMLKNS
jgi:colanic acid biosynthesis glycosyl transferase WcaI